MSNRIRIVDGNIVRDSGPARSSPSNTASRFGSLHSSSSSSSSSSEDNSNSSQSYNYQNTQYLPNRNNNSNSHPRPSSSASLATNSNESSFLDTLAVKLGIHGQYITTPFIPYLNWRPVQVPMVYFAIAGILLLLSMVLGWKAEGRILSLAALALGFYVHMQNTAQIPTSSNASSSSSSTPSNRLGHR